MSTDKYVADALAALRNLPNSNTLNQFDDKLGEIYAQIAKLDGRFSLQSEVMKEFMEEFDYRDSVDVCNREFLARMKKREKADPDHKGLLHDELEAVKEHLAPNQRNVTADDKDAEEMEVLGMSYGRKDPITKVDIKNPVKNKHCGHVYDRDSVQEYIKAHSKRRNSTSTVSCPVAGCANEKNLKMDDIKDFPKFFELVEDED